MQYIVCYICISRYTEKPRLRAKRKITDYPTGAKTNGRPLVNQILPMSAMQQSAIIIIIRSWIARVSKMRLFLLYYRHRLISTIHAFVKIRETEQYGKYSRNLFFLTRRKSDCGISRDNGRHTTARGSRLISYNSYHYHYYYYYITMRKRDVW